MPPVSELRLQRVKLRCETFADRLALDDEPAGLPCGSTHVREPQEVERVRLALASPLPLLGCVRPNSIRRLCPVELHPNDRIRSRHSSRNRSASRGARIPERCHRRSARRSCRRWPYDAATAGPRGRRRSAGTRSPAAVKSPLLAVFPPPSSSRSRPRDSRPEPFADQAENPSVGDPVLEKLHHPPVVDRVEEPTDVGVEHPVHLLPHESHPERIQRVMLAAPRSESIGEAQEVHLVDG